MNTNKPSAASAASAACPRCGFAHVEACEPYGLDASAASAKAAQKARQQRRALDNARIARANLEMNRRIARQLGLS